MDVKFLIQLDIFSEWKTAWNQNIFYSYLIFKEVTLLLVSFKINSHVHYSTELGKTF